MTDIFATGAQASRVWIDDVLIQQAFGAAVLLSSEEPATPPIRNISVTVPGRHGAYDFGGYFEPREFALNIVFPRQDYGDLKYAVRKFTGMFTDAYGRPKTVKLRFGDEIDKYYNVRLTDAVPVERSADRGYLSVVLTAFDPYAYSTVISDEITWGSEDITFEWRYLLGMDGTGGGFSIMDPQTIPIYVDGDSLRPAIEINGTAFGLTVSANGKSFRLPDFANTRWVINGENYEVIQNGAHNLSALIGDFIELVHGENNIAISGTNINVEIKIKHRDKYM